MIFEMLNLGDREIGKGLEIRNVKSRREAVNGVDILTVRGDVANLSEQERMAPMIRVSLYDANDEEVQSTFAALLKNRLPAGAKIEFSAKLPEPSASAQQLGVTFAEP